MNKCIGVLDSGVGGTTTLAAVQELLPEYRYIYACNTNFVPYGNLDNKSILHYSSDMIHSLIDLGCCAIVCACNTATSVGIDTWQKQFTVPIIGIEPAIDLAQQYSSNTKILLLVTQAVARQQRFVRMSLQKNIIVAPQFGLAQDIQKQFDFVLRQFWYQRINQHTLYYIDQKFCQRQMSTTHSIHRYLQNIVHSILSQYDNISSVVLGCTHYSIIKSIIIDYYLSNNQRVNVFDNNYAVAQQVYNALIKF